MKIPKKIAEKRLKRKREISRRMKCHGNKNSCLRDHPYRGLAVPKEISKRTDTIKKLSWWNKLLNKIKNLWSTK